MKKHRVVLATQDELYCERIEEYILETKFPIELEVITDKEYFAFFSGQEKDGIVLVSSEFMDFATADFFQKQNVFILGKATGQETKLKYINPYQKTDTFLREVLLKYSEITGEIAFLSKKQREGRMISFYSPVGGCGKTTLALALASSLASQGKKVFYLNLDPFLEINSFMGEEEKGGFSNVLLSLKQNINNQSLMAISRNIKTEKKTKVFYFSDLENPCDLFEVGEEELRVFLNQMLQINQIDLLIIDLESSLTAQTKAVLELSDMIFIPVLDTAICTNKIESLTEAAEVSAFFESILRKSTWILNQSYGMLKHCMPEKEYITVEKVMPVKDAKRIEQIYEMLKDRIYAVTAMVLEDCK